MSETTENECIVPISALDENGNIKKNYFSIHIKGISREKAEKLVKDLMEALNNVA